ncbi:MAG: TIM-barrel domain-containing protein [Acidaminobacteraceae bacterium]
MMKNDIKYYINGRPIETEAVVDLPKLVYENPKSLSEIEDFDLTITDDSIHLTYEFSDDDMVIGFGETIKGLNKRGSELISFCADEPSHLPNKKSLYGAHNFFIILGETANGYFIDFPGEIKFDIGFQHKDVFNIFIDGIDVKMYKMSANTLKDVVKSFLRIIGESYVPPKWGFGYQQCRWSYENADEVRKIAKQMRNSKIPCDAIYLDIDYMERFKDFTICDEKFPHFKAFVDELKENKFRLIPIIDAGVKIEEGYHVYEEGILKGHFCENEEGGPFVAAVWPGLVHFPDFFREETREWFGGKYEMFTSLGIEGFWNDMNEPAIFYTPKRLQEFYDHVEEAKEKPLDIYSFFNLKDKALNLSNSPEDYSSFYHYVNGKRMSHDKVHNLYGYYMTKSAADGLENIDSDKRYLLFSRASYIGMHRYGGIWMGDNESWWEHIELSIKLLPAINMCGFMYTGADTGGFQSDASSELMIRFMQFSLFTPLMRNHAALATRDHEPFAFETKTTEILKNIIELRYALIPYLYSSYMKSVKERFVYASNLIMLYGDARVREIEDQLLIGNSLMIAPIYKQNQTGRMVYLPEKMLLWRASNYNVEKTKVLSKGDHFIQSSLEELTMFIRPDKGIILGLHAQTVDEIDPSFISFVGFLKTEIDEEFYDDDGCTKAYKNDDNQTLGIKIRKEDNHLIAQVVFDDKSKVEIVKIIVFDEYDTRFEGTVISSKPTIILEKVSGIEK